MMTMLFLLPATTLLVWATCVSGESERIRVDPAQIEPGVTEKLNVTCSAQMPLDMDTGLMKDVISLFIEKVNLENSTDETLASVSVFDEATAVGEHDNLKVSGFADREKIQLELIYTDPDEGQIGTYRCTLNGMDSGHIPVTDVVIKNVSKVENPVDQAAKMVNELKGDVEANKANTEVMAQDLDQLEDNVKNLNDTIEALKAEMANMKAIEEKRFQGLEKVKANSDPRQLETGDFVCNGNCSKWVKFAKPFMSRPHVLTFIRGFKLTNAPQQADNLVSQAKEKNTTGFNLEVTSNVDRSYIGWLAVSETSNTTDGTDE